MQGLSKLELNFNPLLEYLNRETDLEYFFTEAGILNIRGKVTSKQILIINGICERYNYEFCFNANILVSSSLPF